jgi:hypothetical protein
MKKDRPCHHPAKTYPHRSKAINELTHFLFQSQAARNLLLRGVRRTESGREMLIFIGSYKSLHGWSVGSEPRKGSSREMWIDWVLATSRQWIDLNFIGKSILRIQLKPKRMFKFREGHSIQLDPHFSA